MDPLVTLPLFDAFLANRGLKFEAVVVGASALVLMRVVNRRTRDCDILKPVLPPEILDAAVAFAQERRKAGDKLRDDWLNNGPSSLMGVLESGWESRLAPLFQGKALTFQVLGRFDLLCSKLFAMCDREEFDFEDCVALAPTPEELAKALPWLDRQDLNPDWPRHVRARLEELRRSLGHGL